MLISTGIKKNQKTISAQARPSDDLREKDQTSPVKETREY